MPIIIFYIIKFSISLAVFYLFYQLLLRRLTFYNWNRWFLLGYSLLSFFIPFVHITLIEQSKKLENIPVLHYKLIVENSAGKVNDVENIQQSFNYWNLLLAIIVVGIFVLLLKFITQLISLRKIKANAAAIASDDVRIYEVGKNIIPFSFGNAIFINPHLHTEKEFEEIILHEYVHVKQKHTIDILWSEFICIINWYNPFVWLLRHSIRQNLEFIADDNVLKKGFDKKNYQHHLLKVIAQPKYRIANSFNLSSLKKRIVMMNKLKSAKAHAVKFLFVLPLMAVLLLAFRDKYKNVFGEKSSAHNIKASAFEKLYGKLPDVVPPAANNISKNKIAASTQNVMEILNGKAASNNGGDSIKLKLNIIALLEAYIDDPKSNSMRIPINLGIGDFSYEKLITCYNDIQAKRENLIEQRPIDNSALKDIEKQFDKQRSRIKEMLIVLKIKYESEQKSISKINNDDAEKSNNQPLNFSIEPMPQNAIYLVNGVEMPQGWKPEELAKQQVYVTSVNFYKNDSVLKLSDGKARNIIVSLTTAQKTSVIKTDTIPSNTNTVVHQPSFIINGVNENGINQPLFFMDGKEITSLQMRKLDPSIIESITVLKDSSAVKLYGEKAKNGAILVSTKKRPQHNNQPHFDFGGDTLVGTADTILLDKTGLRIVNGSFTTTKSNAQMKMVNGGIIFDSQSDFPLIIYNGKEMNEFKSFKTVEGRFKLISLNVEDAEKKYGEKGNKGAIEISNM